jgi:hypothetical protein
MIRDDAVRSIDETSDSTIRRRSYRIARSSATGKKGSPFEATRGARPAGY